MKAWKCAAIAVALVAAAVIGAAILPPAHAQSSARAVTPQTVQLLSGRGSQIGVTIRDIEDSDTKPGALATSSGVVIDEVSEDSPASRAGLKKGDIVVEFDGERVRGVRQFTRLVHETPAGRKVQTSVMRDGKKLSLTVEPREGGSFSFFGDGDRLTVLRDLARDWNLDIPRPASPAPPAPPLPPRPPTPPAFPDFDTFVWRSGTSLGITVGDLSDQLAEYFGTKDGVLVTSVVDNSAAAKAGIKAGDVITSFNGTDVTSPSDLRRRIQSLRDGDDFTVGIVRDKKATTLKGKAETLRPRRTTRSIV